MALLACAALVRIHDDVLIPPVFEQAGLADLRRLLVAQVCAASGGPCTYAGRSVEKLIPAST